MREIKKELIGWLSVCWEDTIVYPTKEECEKGNPYVSEGNLIEELEEFNNKKVKIIIEEIK